jgi:hypothetical protein
MTNLTKEKSVDLMRAIFYNAAVPVSVQNRHDSKPAD